MDVKQMMFEGLNFKIVLGWLVLFGSACSVGVLLYYLPLANL